MRTILILGLVSASSVLRAQTLNQAVIGANLPPVNCVVGRQDANSQIWQKIVQTMDPQGKTVFKTNQAYIELATGLNHLVNGQWVTSKEEIDISQDGSSASATNGQHQAYFPGDIYSGAIKLITPNGQTLVSDPIGLAYYDGTNSVLLAAVTNSTGAILSSGNEVIYTNAFAGLNADLLYRYTKSGMEQDVILRQQPPDPASLGLNSAQTRLQVLTEFVTAPQPSVLATTVPTDAGVLENDSLGFGGMQMGQGKAFSVGATSPSVEVDKRWVVIQGRQFLIEEVPVAPIATAIDSLPPFISTGSGTPQLIVSKNLAVPPQRLVTPTISGKHFMQLAQNMPLKRGLVLDYQIVNGTLTNCIFQGDTTYYISGTTYLNGTNTFEGGAVLKYATNASLNLQIGSTLNWPGAPYRPVILTAKDDDSVGEQITGSTGSPTNYYANPALNFTLMSNSIVSGFRISFAQQAVNDFQTQLTFYNGQLVNCSIGFASLNKNFYLRNVLFANVQTNFSSISHSTVDAQNVTFAGSLYLNAALLFGGLSLENCVLANVTNLTNSSSYAFANFLGTNNGFYACSQFGTGALSNSFYPFQIVGAGDYYLTNGCVFTNSGITNIDSVLLTSLQQKTTQPPNVYANLTNSLNLLFYPQVPRDSDTPDLGYHYDPIDDIVDNFTMNGAALLLTNGVVLASYNEAGIQLLDGSTIISAGAPLLPNWLVRYQAVQEQSVRLGINGYGPGRGVDVFPSYTNSMPNGQFRFTKFSCPAGGGVHLFNSANSSYGTLSVQDCEFWSGTNYFNGTNGSTTTLKNSLFARSVVNAAGNGFLSFSNNLVWGVASVQLNSSGTNVWYAYNNDFDSSTVTSTNVTNGYNAYLNCSGRLTPTNVNDIVSGSSLAYQTGPLGTFYQPTNSALIHAGSTTADQVGLYHYTVTTNEVVEGSNIVSIGYHYVAVDQNGNPLDTDSDGIPDFIEDANGNGLVDSGETDWQSATDLGLKVFITRPRNGSIIP